MNKRTKKGLIGGGATLVAVLLSAGLVVSTITARNRTVGLDNNPSLDNLENLDNQGQNSGENLTEGTTPENSFNNNVIEENLNNTITNKPVNNEKINELLSGSVEVVLNDNGLNITKTYAFDSATKTYTLTSVVDFGDFISQSTTTGSYVVNDQGVILLYEGAGLNAGSTILGSTTNNGVESVGAIYLDENNNVVYTTQTDAFEGKSDVVVPEAPEVDTETDTEGEVEGDTETEGEDSTDSSQDNSNNSSSEGAETEGEADSSEDDVTTEEGATTENEPSTETEGENEGSTPSEEEGSAPSGEGKDTISLFDEELELTM